MEKKDIQEAMLLAIDNELPAEEHTALMQSIEQDPALLLEWELLQGAIVDIDDTIVFHDKVNLYAIANVEHHAKNKSKLAFFKYAAALAFIVLSTIGVWVISKKSDSMVATNRSNSASQSIKDSASNSQKSIGETVKDIVPEVSNKIAIENKKTINEDVEISSKAPNKVIAQHKNLDMGKRNLASANFGRTKVLIVKKQPKEEVSRIMKTSNLEIESSPGLPPFIYKELVTLNSCEAKILTISDKINQKGGERAIIASPNQNFAISKSVQRKGISFELSEEKFSNSNNKTIQTLYDISKNISTVISDFKEVKNGVHVEVAMPKIFN